MSKLDSIELKLNHLKTRRMALKRKLDDLDKENRSPQDAKKVNTKQQRTPLKLVDNFTQTNEKDFEVVPLNMNCYSDPCYDEWINNQPSKIEDEPVKVFGSSIVITESSYELFSIVQEAKIETPIQVYNHPIVSESENEFEHKNEIEPKESKKTPEIIQKLPVKKEIPKLEQLLGKVANTDPEAKEVNYALSLFKRMFTLDDVKTGIFGNKNNKSSSKTQIPFDYDKTQEFKSLIAKKFSYDEQKMELVWTFIAPKLNSKLSKARRQLKNFVNIC